MEMRAYLSDYVPYAQRILGDMLDFAVNTCDMDIDNISNFSRCLPYPPNFKTETQLTSPKKPDAN